VCCGVVRSKDKRRRWKVRCVFRRNDLSVGLQACRRYNRDLEAGMQTSKPGGPHQKVSKSNCIISCL
jgi:hypothetical protein